LPTAYVNSIPNQETITLRVINDATGCYNETTFNLIVNPLPIANPLPDLVGCDDNTDGISEYFDISNVENTVLGGQTGMDVTFYDSNDNILVSPLPNPYTNTIPYQEMITVRVTNLSTGCFTETALILGTSVQPQITQPNTLFACDEGNGFGSFDTLNVETQLIGNQTGLNVMYFDVQGTVLPSPLPTYFTNTEAWFQTIYVKVENAFNNMCFSETSFDLVVNELPSVNVDNTYFLCNLEPYLEVSVDSSYDTYEWKYQDGNVISNTFDVQLVNAGVHSVTVGKLSNGILCENTYDFELVRSVLPTITDVKYQELSDNNYIEIIASGDGAFEYSINGLNYQDSNVFNNVLGGIYTVYVRDKYGCGEDFREVTLIDYPQFFTPNGDGFNDFWQIRGITEFPNSKIFIYDRYGKLLKQLATTSNGWDGTFNGASMPSDDYWFRVYLENGREVRGHFALKL
jgi:gliding motility-associated-like protein